MNALMALLAAAVVITPESEIVVGANAPAATRLAADELGFFMKDVLGKPLPVVASRTPGRTAILLGGTVPKGLGVDGFVVEAKGDAVRIVGEDGDAPDLNKTAFLASEAPWQTCFRRGTLFGVYDFLERYAGVRMYFPGELGTIVPKKDSIAVPEGRRTVEPVFTVRRYGFDDGTVPKEILAATPEGTETAAKRLNWYRLRMETQHIPCCHGNRWCYLLERFHETHPEYFVLMPGKDGKPERDVSFPTKTNRHKGHLCHTSKVWEEIYQDAKAYFAGKPASSRGIPGGKWGLNTSGNWFDLMPQDGMSWLRSCRCEECMKALGSVAARKRNNHFASELIWRRTCETARRLRADGFKNARVTQMAYIPYGLVPSFEIPDNVDVMVARRGPWGEIDRTLQDRENAEVKAWADKLGHKVWLWNYPDKVSCWNLLMPGVPQLAPRAWASYYKSVRPFAFGAFAESESDNWMYNYLNYYVFSRVAWDPDADVEAILAEHHRLMFGAAAQEMAEFYDILEEKWTKEIAGHPVDSPLGPGVSDAPDENAMREKVFSKSVMDRLGALLDAAARKLSADTIEAKRVAFMKREFFDPLDRRYGKFAMPPLGVKEGMTEAEWEARRTVLLDTLLEMEYGKRPVERPEGLVFEDLYPPMTVKLKDPDSRATRRYMVCRYKGPYGEDSFRFIAFIPANAKKPVPAFLLICNRNPGVNIDVARKQRSGFWPAEEIVKRGYAAIAFWNSELAVDHITAPRTGVMRCFGKPGEERAQNAWGALSAWAWGASRVMDWIETVPSIDKSHVAVVGHSRGGKTALLAGATDRRFAMAVSNCSGCCGAKLHRHMGRKVETIEMITKAAGYWFCPSFAQWRGKDREVPFDQHWLIASIAPNLVYVNSAEGDVWAGPPGERRAAELAEPAWAVYGKKGCVRAHCRPGIHDLTLDDWNRFMDFAGEHGWR